MCDNKNELHKSEKDKSKRNTSTRLDLDITDTTDTYPEFDFLDLLRNLQVENRKVKNKVANDESGNKSNSYSDDSDVELLARFYDEKYGKDYEFDADGYDEDDSFIDNSDAVIDLIPNGIQTEFGGFYINRGKLSFIREENSSSSISEDVDKFLAQKKLVIKKIGHDDENDEKRKESSKNPGNNTVKSNCINNKSNNNSNNNVQNSSNINTVNTNVNNITNNSSNIYSIGNGTIKNRKRSGEFHHKSKKNRKTATPKIPDHLIHRKPFSGSSEFRKNINEIKKNRMKNLEADRKIVSSDLITSDSPNSTNIATATTSITVTTAATTTVTNLTSINKNSNNCNTINNNNKSNINDSEMTYTNISSSAVNHNNNNNSSNNNNNNDHHNYANNKKEVCLKKKAATVKEILKDRNAASEIIEAVATGADSSCKTNDGESSSDSESSESSNSDSSSESSEDKFSEKRKLSSRSVEESHDSQRKVSLNGVLKEDFTAKNFAHLNDGLKSLIDKIVETSKEEKTKLSNSKLNGLLLRIDGRLRELPASERNAVLDHLATVLQLKKESIIKKTKKLHFVQEEAKMAFPLRRLKEIVTEMMPTLESNYLKEFTKATGTSGVEPGSLPQKKFPWNEEIRYYLREIIRLRENCYHIVRPRKESLSEYVKNFLETKIKPLWPKDWMTVDLLWEEGKGSNTGSTEDKSKTVNKSQPVQNSQNANQKKGLGNFQNLVVGNKKSVLQTGAHAESSKTNPNINKIPEAKSILIPRKAPQNAGSNPKPNYPASSGGVIQANSAVNRFPVPATKSASEFFDKISSHSNVLSRGSTQQISSNKTQQQPSPNRVIKPVSCSVVQNPVRPNIMRTTSPNSATNKSVPYRNCNSQQNVYKTIEIHSKPVSGSKSVGNSVTISPVTESMLKDISSSPEILNLTKNPSVCISKITDCPDKQLNRSNSPSINRPLPSGITISPTNAISSSFLSKQKKPVERTSDNRINVSITKQEPNAGLVKDKRKSVLNVNMKRGPLQNIPDCISVTSNLMSQERYNKVEHVRKRAIQEYHEQQQLHQQQQQRQLQDSPERLKIEEKKIKLEDNFLSDIEIKEENIEDKNFSKIFDSVIAKTSETVRHADDSDCQMTSERYSGIDGDSYFNSSALPTFCSSGLSHYKNKAPKLRDIRVGKEKPFLLVKSDNSTQNISDETKLDECEEHSDNVKELQVQQEMDRVMQNLVELSNQRIKDQDYEMESHYSSNTPTSRSQSSFQVYPKISYK